MSNAHVQQRGGLRLSRQPSGAGEQVTLAEIAIVEPAGANVADQIAASLRQPVHELVGDGVGIDIELFDRGRSCSD